MFRGDLVAFREQSKSQALDYLSSTAALEEFRKHSAALAPRKSVVAVVVVTGPAATVGQKLRTCSALLAELFWFLEALMAGWFQLTGYGQGTRIWSLHQYLEMV